MCLKDEGRVSPDSPQDNYFDEVIVQLEYFDCLVHSNTLRKSRATITIFTSLYNTSFQ